MPILQRLSLLIRTPAVARLALLVSVALLGGVIAYWTIQFSAPRVAARPAVVIPSTADAARAVVSRHLFGKVERTAIASAAAPFAESTAVQVLGVASSGPSGGGFAVISLDGKAPISVIDGQEFAPGHRLTKVTAKGIEYERGGIAYHAPLRTKPATKSNSPAPPAAVLPPSVTMPVTPAPAS